MVVGTDLPNVPSKLRHFHFTLELLLETREEYFALRRLEAVEYVRDRSTVVISRKEHELSVDEVRVVDAVVLGLAIIEECVLLHAAEPPLPVFDLALRKSHLDEACAGSDITVLIAAIHVVITANDIRAEFVEVNRMGVEIRKVLSSCLGERK